MECNANLEDEKELEVMLMTQNVDGIQDHLIKKSKTLMYTPDKHVNVSKAEQNQGAFTPHIINLHGTMKFMHCYNSASDHYEKLYPVLSLDELNNKMNLKDKDEAGKDEESKNEDEVEYVPKCHECGGPMKPHIQFFDDFYNEAFYRSTTVERFIQ